MKANDVFKPLKENHIIEQLQILGVDKSDLNGMTYRELVNKLASERAIRE